MCSVGFKKCFMNEIFLEAKHKSKIFDVTDLLMLLLCDSQI